MMKYPLNSHFANRIRNFVDYKLSLGCCYEENCRILWHFDQFCMERFPDKQELDRDIGLAWLEIRSTEQASSHRNRVMVLREFGKYLQSTGENAFLIPIEMTRKGPRYVPHIFTSDEVKAFFYGADHFTPHEKGPGRHLVIPVFFRLLYCCGLRPSEARLLLKEDVDLVRGILYIRESKGHKDRAVPVSEELLELMRRYWSKITAIYPDTTVFFPRYDGKGPYSKCWTIEMFWWCFRTGGIEHFDDPKPRVYDFRHTFATDCIYRWMREGKDVDAMLPILSAYMGHARFEDTAYYIHMVPDFYQRTGTVNVKAFEALLPEVPYED